MKSKKLKNTKYEQLYVEKEIGEFEEKSGIYYRECQRKAFSFSQDRWFQEFPEAGTPSYLESA